MCSTQVDARPGPGVGHGSHPAGPLETVQAGLDALAAAHVEAVGIDTLAGEIEELHAQVNRLQAQLLRRLAAFDSADGPETVTVGAAGSLQAWLRNRLREAPGQAKALATAAQRWEALPEVAAAFTDGDIGLAHVRVITRAATDWRLDAVQQAEPALVHAAHRLDGRQLGQVLARLRTAADPDHTAKSVTAADRRRRVELGVFDGMLLLDAALPMAAGGEQLLTALDALERPDPPDTPIPLRRSRPQRLADALADLAELALDGRATPQVGGERPHLTVTAAIPAALPLSTTNGSPAEDDRAAWSILPGTPVWGQLDWGGVIGRDALERIACDAQVTRVVTDLAGNPLAVDQTRRTIPAGMRRALVARDRGCRGPYCDRPPAWCEAHHIHHWANHGEHKLDNLILACRRCHMLVHERRWTVKLLPDATVEWTDRNGATHTTRPDPIQGHAQQALAQLAGRAPP